MVVMGRFPFLSKYLVDSKGAALSTLKDCLENGKTFYWEAEGIATTVSKKGKYWQVAYYSSGLNRTQHLGITEFVIPERLDTANLVLLDEDTWRCKAQKETRWKSKAYQALYDRIFQLEEENDKLRKAESALREQIEILTDSSFVG